MKILIILLSLTFIFSKVDQDFQFQFQSDSEEKSDYYITFFKQLYNGIRFPLFEMIKKIAQEKLNTLTNETEWKTLKLKDLGYGLIDETCKYYVMNNIFSDYDLFLNKIYNSLVYTTKQQNDLRGYKKCLSFDSKTELKDFNKSLDPFLEYVILVVDKSNTKVLYPTNETKKFEVNSTNIFSNFHINSFCLPNNLTFCNETSLEIFYGGAHEYIKGYIRENETQNFKVYIFNTERMTYKFDFLKFIPFIILSLHILISFIGQLSNKLTKFKIFQFFNLEENMEESFNINLAITKYNNFKGLNYINSLIGISMIFMIFGSVFLLMLNLPIISYEYQSLYLLMKNLFYSFFFIGIRYSPRILISCSGFTLSFKFISYLNNNKSYLRFLLYQIHKFFFLIIVILFYQHSLYYLKTEISASWYYFSRTSIENAAKIDIYDLLIYHFLNDRSDNQFFLKQNFIDYLWLPYNEIVLFLFGSLLIFICYKFNWRLDLICIIGFFGLIISKIIYFNYFVNKIFSTLYFFYFNYGKYMANPIFNLSYFLIGIFFGLINYCIENGLYIIDEKSNLNEKNIKSNENKKTRYTHDLEGKSYLKIPCYIFHLIKKCKKLNIFLSIFILILLLIPSLLQFFYLNLLEIKIDKKNNNNYINYFINDNIIMIIYNFDIEVIVLIIYLLIFLYIKSFFLVKSFFNLEIWRFFGKIYFTFTVCINLVILCIFYSDNKKISLKFESIFLYSIINVISIIIISILAYLFFELPYKKLIKNYYKESNLNNSEIINNSNEIENDEEEEESDYDN